MSEQIVINTAIATTTSFTIVSVLAILFKTNFRKVTTHMKAFIFALAGLLGIKDYFTKLKIRQVEKECEDYAKIVKYLTRYGESKALDTALMEYSKRKQIKGELLLETH